MASLSCARHPGVETGLRCGKCDTPICPRCLVQTPVGARCPDCAQVRRLPTYQVSPAYYLRALGAGLGMALVSGGAWAFLFALVPFFYLYFILSAGAGYFTGEAISLATNHKRGPGLQGIAALSMALAYVVSSLFLNTRPLTDPFGLIALGLGIFIAISRLR